MERAEAYATLATELERWRRLPFHDLVGLVGAAPTLKSVTVGAEVIDVDVRVAWVGARRDAVRIEAAANGPSCWRLERLEEAVTVSAPQSSGPAAG